jgi:hypothetical protein
VAPFHLGAAAKADLVHGGKSRKASGYTRTKRGGVAQRLERRTHNPQVGGSNPPAAISLGEPIRYQLVEGDLRWADAYDMTADTATLEEALVWLDA